MLIIAKVSPLIVQYRPSTVYFSCLLINAGKRKTITESLKAKNSAWPASNAS